MKTVKFLILLVALCGIAIGQELPPESKPDMELTKKEAELRIADWQMRIKGLEDQLAKTQGDQTALRTQIEDARKNLKDCRDALAALIGATEAEIEAYKQRLGALEGKVRDMKRLSNDELADRRAEVEALDAELQVLKQSKISVLPEFFPRIVSLQNDIKGLYREKKTNTYTVGTWAENRDCLWNISGKTEIYADPHMWPKIWQGNTDQIKNPDIIHPGQVLQIPPKGPMNDDESKAERKYYRNKRAKMTAAQQDGTATGQN